MSVNYPRLSQVLILNSLTLIFLESSFYSKIIENSWIEGIGAINRSGYVQILSIYTRIKQPTAKPSGWVRGSSGTRCGVANRNGYLFWYAPVTWCDLGSWYPSYYNLRAKIKFCPWYAVVCLHTYVSGLHVVFSPSFIVITIHHYLLWHIRDDKFDVLNDNATVVGFGLLGNMPYTSKSATKEFTNGCRIWNALEPNTN